MGREAEVTERVREFLQGLTPHEVEITSDGTPIVASTMLPGQSAEEGSNPEHSLGLTATIATNSTDEADRLIAKIKSEIYNVSENPDENLRVIGGIDMQAFSAKITDGVVKVELAAAYQ